MAKLKNSITGCRNPAQFIGEWMMEADKLEHYREYASRFDFVELARLAAEREDKDRMEEEQEAKANLPKPKPYELDNGVAVFRINGPTLKYPDSFNAGTSTIKLERAMRLATADPDVKAAILRLEDAPGGTVAGAFELRDAIESFAKSKPLEAVAIDLCASASYLFGSACPKIWANPTAYIGSIGVLSALKDSKDAHDKAGVKVIPLSTGIHKHTGMPGVEITPEQIAQRQAHVDELNGHFVDSVSKHRKIDKESILKLEAGVMLASKAVEAKLIDGIDSFENVLNRLKSQVQMERQAETPTVTDPFGSANAMNIFDQIKLILKDSSLTEVQAMAKIQGLVDANAKLNGDLATVAKSLESTQASLANAMAVAGKIEPAEITAGRLDLLGQRAELAVKDKLPAPAAAAIKLACGLPPEGDKSESKPNAFMLTPRAELGGKSVGEWAITLFDSSPTAITTDGGKVKTQQRAIPGKNPPKPVSAQAVEAGDEVSEMEASADEDLKTYFGNNKATAAAK